METFEEILELDDWEEDREFSRRIVSDYLSQAARALEELDDALAQSDLATLSELGQYLKGSSTALGVRRVQAACEKIQSYGRLFDEDKNVDLSQQDALALIRKTLTQVKVDYAEAEKWLRKYSNNPTETDS
ncbi:hypothetical protein H1R20_g1972, partial [Candolleomyces eurysporus]